MESKLKKLALRRELGVPAGQRAAMHVNCPCGETIDITSEANTCHKCGLTVDGGGWIIKEGHAL